jgi:peptide-methionine (S)-S-oxide reductase
MIKIFGPRTYLFLAFCFLGALTMSAHASDSKPPEATGPAVAIFAGGCFWCEEEVYEKMPGVISVISGYTGGSLKDPTYEQVSAGGTGHVESVQVTYDPSQITYEKLLDLFWHNIDPFDPFGQFCDRGGSYKAVIFYSTPEQKTLAEASKARLEKKFKKRKDSRFHKPITTEIRAATKFYPAEDYHQKYAEKNPIRYSFYRGSCGRDGRLEEIWGKEKEKK